MPPRPRRNADTGAVRRDAKRRRASSSRWMHLSAAEVSSRTVIQRGWALNNRAVARVTYFAAAMLALRQAVLHADPAPETVAAGPPHYCIFHGYIPSFQYFLK